MIKVQLSLPPGAKIDKQLIKVQLVFPPGAKIDLQLTKVYPNHNPRYLNSPNVVFSLVPRGTSPGVSIPPPLTYRSSVGGGGTFGGYQKDSHSLLTPVGSADFKKWVYKKRLKIFFFVGKLQVSGVLNPQNPSEILE